MCKNPVRALILGLSLGLSALACQVLPFGDTSCEPSGAPPSEPYEGPLGERIAYTSIGTTRCGSHVYPRGQVYVMEPDGSHRALLADEPNFASEPAWSPDGTHIAFCSFRNAGTCHIFVMEADGSGLIQLTDGLTDDTSPTWSPDGTHIAYTSERYDQGRGIWMHQDIYVMDADGSHPIRLTTNPALDLDPAWSPDGTQIAFTSTRDGSSAIYVMAADGSHPMPLTSGPSHNTEPAWSPDGTRIAFFSDRDGNDEIYVMDADGANPVRLTDDPARDRDPEWSPDGTRIAFSSDHSGNYEIYAMDSDGSNVVRLTNEAKWDSDCPAWRP